MPKMTVNPEAQIELVAGDHTLIISNKDSVIFKCTRCGGTKDIFYHEYRTDLPGMATCTCNAPHTGGDTQPLPAVETPDLPSLTDTIMPFHARFVERQDGGG